MFRTKVKPCPQVSKESASLLEDILLLETVGPIVLCLLAGPFSDR